jgi:hypothetical protein
MTKPIFGCPLIRKLNVDGFEPALLAASGATANDSVPYIPILNVRGVIDLE